MSGPPVPCLKRTRRLQAIQTGSAEKEKEISKSKNGAPRNKLTMQRPRFALTAFQGSGEVYVKGIPALVLYRLLSRKISDRIEYNRDGTTRYIILTTPYLYANFPTVNTSQ